MIGIGESYVVLFGILGGNIVGLQLQKRTKDDPAKKLAVDRFFFFFNAAILIWSLHFIFFELPNVLRVWLF